VQSKGRQDYSGWLVSEVRVLAGEALLHNSERSTADFAVQYPRAGQHRGTQELAGVADGRQKHLPEDPTLIGGPFVRRVQGRVVHHKRAVLLPPAQQGYQNACSLGRLPGPSGLDSQTGTCLQRLLP